MNAYHTNRYCDRLLVLYRQTTDSTAKRCIALEWRAAWADLLRQYNERLLKRLT